MEEQNERQEDKSFETAKPIEGQTRAECGAREIEQRYGDEIQSPNVRK